MFFPPTRHANNAKAAQVSRLAQSRMTSPLKGSLAKLCTDTNTPERTRKVPSRLALKASNTSSTAQANSLCRTRYERRACSAAVASNHGMSEAFSTGSQNQKPPQPSSS